MIIVTYGVADQLLHLILEAFVLYCEKWPVVVKHEKIKSKHCIGYIKCINLRFLKQL